MELDVSRDKVLSPRHESPHQHNGRVLILAFLAVISVPQLVHGQGGPAPEFEASPKPFWKALTLVCVPLVALALVWLTRVVLLSSKNRGRHLVLASAMALYGLACALPALEGAGHGVCTGFSDRPAGTYPGLGALLLGWIPPYTVSWFANPLFFVAWILLAVRRFRVASWFGGAATLSAVTTIGFIPLGKFSHLLPGFVLWQAAMIALLVGAASLAHNRVVAGDGADG
jgi:hypothetical protein